jgi:branched-chain amino acid transport system ATP-binding protein
MGKTTTVRSIMGLTPAIAGSIRFDGREIRGLPCYQVAKLGIGLVPEGRQVFPNLTARENLVATAANRGGAADPWTLDKVCALFPRLAERTGHLASQLSGGEQQMLAISRALMLRPKLLLLDEPSFGLAPIVVKDIFTILRTINREDRVSMLIVEQNANLALDLADHAFLIETGRVAVGGGAAAIRGDDAVRRVYLGY